MISNTKMENLQALSTADFNFEKFYDSNINVEEKVTDAIFLLNSINTTDRTINLFNQLKLEKTNIVNLYEIISSNLKEKLLLILDEIFEWRIQKIELERKMDQISYSMKVDHVMESVNSYSISTTTEYKEFLSHYDKTVFLSQKIVKNKMEITKILDTQKMLDKSYSFKMREIDSQVIKLNELIKNFENIQYLERSNVPDIYSNFFSTAHIFENLILEKEESFNAQVNELTNNVASLRGISRN